MRAAPFQSEIRNPKSAILSSVNSKDLILDFHEYDLGNVLADQEAIRAMIPQRGPIEQLTAIVHEDFERSISVGYKDVGHDEFWVKGHMPGLPLMPGVMMCEAAAQLSSYHVQKHNMLQTEMIGFGGLDKVRFRGVVVPGDRLVVVVQKLQLRPKRIMRCRFQCFVKENLVCEGELTGIPIPTELLRAGLAAK
jgi:3-hydroxyacyl-[acyl-carrier-protein] dehydratase